MIYFSLFLAGYTVGVFAALLIFAPEKQIESWDPQNFPVKAEIKPVAPKDSKIKIFFLKSGKLAKSK